MTLSRVDVHAHLLPGIDDGCQTVEESLLCAQALVGAGYSHCFCTPHIWPNLPANNVLEIPRLTADLQRALDAAGIRLRLIPGGEIKLGPDYHLITAPDDIPTFAMAGRYAMIDLWAQTLPGHFEAGVRWLHAQGVEVILAHPERMRAVQDQPQLADYFAELGMLLQGNLQCFSDAAGSYTRRTVERFMNEDRYFVLGSDMHGPASIEARMRGLHHAIQFAGAEKIAQLTIENPRRLLPETMRGGAVKRVER
jgi:protein-tyrosine phosphatase